MQGAALVRSHPLSTADAAAPIAVRSCGAIARRALLACDGVTRPVKGFEATSFRLAGHELIWIGVDAPVHPRAVLVDAAQMDVSATRLEVKNAQVHIVETVGGQRFPSVDALQSLTRAILRLVKDEKPAGFGHLLAAQTLPFPLSHRRDAALALAQSCADRKAETFTRTALRLLGVGCGLTPSGDDFVGGALFALHAFGITDGTAASQWNDARTNLLAAAPARTHFISSALLHDLARGESYAALHALAFALRFCEERGEERGEQHREEHAMLDAMCALVAVGHSSGWDMLTGFIAAVSGTRHLISAAYLTQPVT